MNRGQTTVSDARLKPTILKSRKPWSVPCFALTLLLGLASTSTAHAKVIASSATGFVVEHKVQLSVDAHSAYASFLNVGSWWASSHSFSGDAKNITIETNRGGCWCESLPDGGFVRHMDVIHAAPGAMLVFAGGLGPLQFMGVAGSMTVTFQAAGELTTVTLRYDVGGRDDKDFAEISAAVDGVLTEQLAHYASFVKTAKP